MVETAAGGFSAGDKVFGMPFFPKQAAAYAEQIAAPASELALKPSGLDYVQAAALPLAGLTAWQGLVGAGRLQQGHRVLIHAAAGGVGHLAVQIAKARGAYVVATASAGKLDFVRSLGADEVIDYTASDFIDLARDIDMVLDPIGGEHVSRSLQTLRSGGVLVALLDPSDDARSEASSRGIRLDRISVSPDRDGLVELIWLVDAGKLAVHVARTFPLDQAAAAHAYLGTRPMGKVVLTM